MKILNTYPSGENLQGLVNALKEDNRLKSEHLEQAFLKVDRAEFCDDTKTAYIDHWEEIRFNSRISAPHMHAILLEAVAENLKPGARVLDVGCGSGILLAYSYEACGR